MKPTFFLTVLITLAACASPAPHCDRRLTPINPRQTVSAPGPRARRAPAAPAGVKHP